MNFYIPKSFYPKKFHNQTHKLANLIYFCKQSCKFKQKNGLKKSVCKNPQIIFFRISHQRSFKINYYEKTI
ncbi:hypothetical protein EB354_00050 [Chryseobacterium balustinum]|nr:hypothetical protein EB354_00050 [Chryseobacterium balustinum]